MTAPPTYPEVVAALRACHDLLTTDDPVTADQAASVVQHAASVLDRHEHGDRHLPPATPLRPPLHEGRRPRPRAVQPASEGG